ncbi:hypothetical protein HHS34_005605 [Acidithiobacillus montserratensis]|uniref:Uncharacterized protein n=1 Tax=Acidithiobacillus montserratensis TaxID=2729135 RepID=A0ACD5HIS1_9PROT|nr:hypothetical protein [Acidithiobacillus montserratensis]MBU2747847.1 hypothetical protein [Acidithiobacillus montserratensis]
MMDELEELERLQAATEKMMADKTPAKRSRSRSGAPPPTVAEEESATGTTVSTVSVTEKDAADSPVEEEAGIFDDEISVPDSGEVVGGDGDLLDPLFREILARLESLPEGIVDALRKVEATPSANKPAFPTIAPSPHRGWFRRFRKEPAEEDAAVDREDASVIDTDTQEDPSVQQRRQDVEALFQAVEDRVFSHAMTHHSSTVVMIGWAFALLSFGLGLSVGYIQAVARFPAWWPKPGTGLVPTLASAFLGAPVGVLLLPIVGYVVWKIGKEGGSRKRPAALVQGMGILMILAGVALPFVGAL